MDRLLLIAMSAVILLGAGCGATKPEMPSGPKVSVEQFAKEFAEAQKMKKVSADSDIVFTNIRFASDDPDYTGEESF